MPSSEGEIILLVVWGLIVTPGVDYQKKVLIFKKGAYLSWDQGDHRQKTS